jgi:hypothetical protein
MRTIRTTAMTLALALGLTAPALGGEVAELLGQGPIAPCLADHFDPDRYQDDLAALGWLPLADAAIPQVSLLMAVAFLPLTNPAVPGRPDVGSVRVESASLSWADELRARQALTQGNSVLSLRGETMESGVQSVECWLVTPDGEFIEGLLARVQSDSPIPSDAAVAAMLEPEQLSDRTQVQVIVSRNPNPPGPAVGLVTQMLISPAP